MEIRSKGGFVVTVSTDEWDEILFRDEQRALGMFFLSDPDQEVIELYGLSDATLGKEVARPASFILDGDGQVLWRHLPKDWRIRLSADEYMEVFERYQTSREIGR